MDTFLCRVLWRKPWNWKCDLGEVPGRNQHQQHIVQQAFSCRTRRTESSHTTFDKKSSSRWMARVRRRTAPTVYPRRTAAMVNPWRTAAVVNPRRTATMVNPRRMEDQAREGNSAQYAAKTSRFHV